MKQQPIERQEPYSPLTAFTAICSVWIVHISKWRQIVPAFACSGASSCSWWEKLPSFNYHKRGGDSWWRRLLRAWVEYCGLIDLWWTRHMALSVTIISV